MVSLLKYVVKVCLLCLVREHACLSGLLSDHFILLFSLF